MNEPNRTDKISVWKNVRSFLRLAGACGNARFFEDDCVTLYDGGAGDAYENYALIDPSAICGAGEAQIRRVVRTGLDFFEQKAQSGQKKQPHIWPLFMDFPSIGTLSNILAESGLHCAGSFFAMRADVADVAPSALCAGGIADAPDWIFEVADDPCMAAAWANATWSAFEDEDVDAPISQAPPNFLAFAHGMARSGRVSLCALRAAAPCAEIAATGMLIDARECAGIYYVATRARYRRMGLGSRMMAGLLARGASLGFRAVCLLATPEGRPLYLRTGFSEAGEVPIYICEARAPF